MAPRQKSSSSGMPATSHQQISRYHHHHHYGGSSGSRSHKYGQMDFGSLNIHALRKYGQAFNLNLKSRSSKEELVMAASHHFSNQMVDEVDTIARFLYTVHSNRGAKRTLNSIL